MESWWTEKETFEKILWGIAIVFSLLFIVQTIFSFLGGDGAEGHSDESIGEDDGIHYQFFTIRNMVAFFTMFAWTGITCTSLGLGKGLTVAVSTGTGVLLVVAMVIILASASRLRASGTLQMKNALDKVGEVYIPIPAKRSGQGKIHIQVQGRLQELDAVTDEEVILPREKMVKVVDIINDRILLVASHK